MSTATPCTAIPASNADTTTSLSPADLEAIRLYSEEGLSIENVRKTTGLPNHYVRALLKGKPRTVNTPFSKSVSRVYDLAIRPHGIKDHELRSILHEEYGSNWNEQKGCYQAKYTDDTIKQVKEKVRDRASDEGQFAKFVMDWVCDGLATESRVFLESAALNLMARVDECVDDFMELFATHKTEDSDAADLAQRKQVYAVRRHLLKLVSGLHQEPVSRLLERTTAITNAIDGTSDLPAPSVVGWHSDKPEPLNESEPLHQIEDFLDHVEARGWC
ncbi:hypothetical protein P3W53_00090 [Pseudomonas denitrificans (nom. rej.)]|nr:hypothetical protein [Pseudomonas denitrificans (nom. rej.)]